MGRGLWVGAGAALAQSGEASRAPDVSTAEVGGVLYEGTAARRGRESRSSETRERAAARKGSEANASARLPGVAEGRGGSAGAEVAPHRLTSGAGLTPRPLPLWPRTELLGR